MDEEQEEETRSQEEKDGLVQCVTDRASVGIHISAA